MKSRPTPIRAGSQARKLYDRLHLGWRAGVLDSWYYGRRSPTDSTVVWQVDGVEYDGNDLAGVAAAIDVAFSRAGITDAVFGSSWCGFCSLQVTYTDGARLTERYDSAIGRVVREYDMAGAIVAGSEAA